MGDYKVHCKIEFCGEVYVSYLNWPPYDIHEDVYTWIHNVWGKHCDKISNLYLKHEIEQREKDEYELYLRLKEKYKDK